MTNYERREAMSEPRTNCAPECVRGWHVEGCPNRYALTIPAPPPGDGPRTLGRVEPVQGRIVVCGAGEDDAPRPAPDDGRPMHSVCPGCGPHVAADEDGCCVHCGADCTGEPCGGHVCGTELEAACAEAGRLREEVRLVRAALEAHPDSDLVGLAAATLRAAAAADDEHAENLRLRAAREALATALEKSRSAWDGENARTVAAQAEAGRLREALRDFGVHRTDCRSRGLITGQDRSCTCGLAAAKEETE